MRCLFISDAHYPIGDEIVDFLLGNYQSYDVIYILGDLFEFYYGYENFIYPHHLKLINVLKFISSKVKIKLFEGNHEYRLERIKEFVNLDVIKSSSFENINGFRVFLAHGDTIDKFDISYRLFRSFLKNGITLSIIERIPPWTLLYLSKMASRISKENLKSKNYRGTEIALENFARSMIKSGVDVVILGHTHTPLFKKFNNGLYINSGEFFKHFSYAVYDGREFKLCFWEARNDKRGSQKKNRGVKEDFALP